MKRMLILAAAMCTLAALLVCTSVDFDNPLDRRGTKFLEGDTTNADKKLESNANGVANYFDPDENNEYYRGACKTVPPAISIVGATSNSIASNEVIEFLRLMGRGANGFDGVVTVSEPDILVSAMLTRNGVDSISFPPAGMPPIADFPAQFIIVYKATQTRCPNRPVGTAQRSLTITAQDAAVRPPTISILGQLEVAVDKDAVYTDEGARAYRGNGALLPAIDTVKVLDGRPDRDDIVISRYNNVSDFGLIQVETGDTTRPVIIEYVAVAVETLTVSPLRDTIMVTRARRNVRITGGTVVNVPRPIFVLDTYSYSFPVQGGGTATFRYPDTAVSSNVGAGGYRPKNVTRVYYINRDGNEIEIPLSMVTTTGPNLPVGSVSTATVRYSVNAGAGYQAADTTRRVFAFDGMCDSPIPTAPTVTITGGSGDITLQATDVRWTEAPTLTSGWSVTSNNLDEEGHNRQWPVRYMLDFGGLDPNNLRIGTYKITYVGLGLCGGIGVAQRTVTVR